MDKDMEAMIDRPGEFRISPENNDRELRDWFAGMALQGILANCASDTDCKAKELAYEAYLYADKMMEARER